jgi:hypothetical protein
MGNHTAAIMRTAGTIMGTSGKMRARAAAKMTRRGMPTAARVRATTAGVATTASRMSLGDNRCSTHQGAQNTRGQQEASTFGTHGKQSPMTLNVYNAARANWCTTPTQLSIQSDRNAALNIM